MTVRTIKHEELKGGYSDGKKIKKSCNGSKNKVYSGCIYKEVDKSKKSIYAQILEKVKQSKPPSGGLG